MSLMITRRTPLADVRRLNQMLDQAFTAWPFANGSEPATGWVPATDIMEDSEGLKVVLELPGLKPEDVKITLENYTLTIRGEKKQLVEEHSRVHRYERSYGAFERSFTLPNTLDPDRVAATFEHGVLTIAIPKAEKAKAREIQVKVS
ncbi:MAG: Hsp20/alpha crystallin family protein [Gemmatimonadales bacterium]